MKVVEYEQGSSEWLAWRKSRVCASDLPIILGLSPWATPRDLWRTKMGFDEGPKSSFAMRRGIELEPMVRALVSDKLSMEFVPRVVADDWGALPVGASLDGIAANYVLEIKVPNVSHHAEAVEGRVPAIYYPQVQWQMAVAESEQAYYVSYHDASDQDLAIVLVEYDEDYVLNTLLPAAVDFWYYVEYKKEPPPSDRDIIPIDDEQFLRAAEQWRVAKTRLDEAQESEKLWRARLIDLSDDNDCCGGGVTLRRVNRSGSTDWKKLYKDLSSSHPDVAREYPLERYTKEQIGYWKLSLTD